jgi:copper resistance protein C
MRAPGIGGRLVRRSLAVAAGLLIGLVGLAFGAQPASAHTRLLSSTPANNTTVSTAPDVITLLFAQHLLGLGAVAVQGPDGRDVAVGAAELDGATVTQRLAGDRPAGVYRLSYRIVSADGHPVSGGVTFTATSAVGSGATSAAATATAGAGAALPGVGASSSGGGSSTGLVVGLVVAVGALVVGSGAVILRRTRRGQRSTDGA